MNVPLQIGLPQVVLLIIAMLGLGLLIYALRSLFVTIRTLEEYEDERGQTYRRWRHRRRFRWQHGLGGLLAVVLAVSLLWVTFAIQTYLGLTSDIKVATVSAAPIQNIDHLMSVSLTLYDANGNPTTKTYGVHGDEWMLEGDILKFPTWMNIFGIHSGFKVTRLEGRYDDPNLERTAERSVIELNGGDDNFFTTAQKQAWTSPFVQAAYGNAVFLKADNKSYNVYASQDALTASPNK